MQTFSRNVKIWRLYQICTSIRSEKRHDAIAAVVGPEVKLIGGQFLGGCGPCLFVGMAAAAQHCTPVQLMSESSVSTADSHESFIGHVLGLTEEDVIEGMAIWDGFRSPKRRLMLELLQKAVCK